MKDKAPKGKRNGGGLHARGHYSNQGKGSISHAEFHALDHGGKGEYIEWNLPAANIANQ